MIGGGGFSAAIFLLNWRVNRIEKSIEATVIEVKKMHHEGMSKFEKYIEVTNELLTQVAIHNQRFLHSEERMDRIEERLKLVGERTHVLSNDVLKLEAKIERVLKND